MNITFPHCDPRVLHAPGECEFCDMRPEWQELRQSWGINFTGKNDPEKVQCPAEKARGIDSINRWGGNRPKQNLEESLSQSATMSADNFLRLLAANRGAITSSSEHDQEEIDRARDEGRFYVDAAGFGYIWDSLE